jgi:hypothetical protein
MYAKALRGRGQLPVADIVSYLEKRFAGSLQLMATQQFPILETASFVNGQLDCSEIFNLNTLVRGEQLEEFYWEAVRGLAVFLRTVFTTLLNDEVGNSYTGRQLNVVWKAFLTEVDQEIQQYQLYRAGQHAQNTRNRFNDSAFQSDVNWKGAAQKDGTPLWSPEWQRRSI